MKTRILSSLAAACVGAAGLALGACHHDQKTASRESTGTVAMTNTNCPFSGKPANSSVCSDYRGQKVCFCCAGCKAKFDAMSDADKEKMMAAKK